MYSYYLEYRFHSYSKHYLRRLIRGLARKFRVKEAVKYRSVPHMTLYGPFQIMERKIVFSSIEKVARNYNLVPFAISDFCYHHGRNGKVIACEINASQELKKLRKELAFELNKTVNEDNRQTWDNDSDYWFHSTIAMKDIDGQFDQIWEYIKTKDKPNIKQYLLRITVLNNRRKIEREYDLMFKRWLSRREALSNRLWQKTVNRLRELQNLPKEKEPSLLDRIKRLFCWL
ncbi:MAG: 2'-5' RNA ligase family protein [Dehalococcoidales bacterium]|nr:2'-5' RNA ligase family protein [Dehalococcoidales bacterium]